MLKGKNIGGVSVDGGTYGKAAVLVVGPILGLVYAVFLPFIGIALLLQTLAVKIFGGAANSLVKGVSFGWRPIEAYLTGKKNKKSSRK